MKPFIIHNTNRTDRYNHLQEQLASQGITDYEIIPAVMLPDPKTGCAWSHKECIKKAIEVGLDWVPVFEDDIVFTDPNSWQYFLQVFETIPEDWDLYLGGVYYQEGIRGVTPKMKRLDVFSCTHCVVYRKSIYQYVLDNPEGVYNDIWLSLGHRYNKYLCWPMPAIQQPGYSDIMRKEVNHTKLLHDRKLITYTG